MDFTRWAELHPCVTDFKEFDTLAQKLWDVESFHIARYNDGEWLAMLRIEPHFTKILDRNGHDHETMHQFGLRLLDIIKGAPPYYIGVDSATRVGHRLVYPAWDKIKPMLDRLPNLVYGDLFNAATLRWGIAALLYPLRSRRVIVVGPEHLSKLNVTQDHIVVPERDCWDACDSIEYQTNKLLRRYQDEHPVILYSCSMLAKYLVDVFYHRYGDSITQMDVGSCLDPWVGVRSRPWHENILQYVTQRKRVTSQQARKAGQDTPLPPYGGWGYDEQEYQVRHILD